MIEGMISVRKWGMEDYELLKKRADSAYAVADAMLKEGNKS